MPPSPFLSEHFDRGWMIEKRALDAINGAILEKAEQKIAVLHRIQEFKKGVDKLRWENVGLRLKVTSPLHIPHDIKRFCTDRGCHRENERDTVTQNGQRDATRAFKRGSRTATAEN